MIFGRELRLYVVVDSKFCSFMTVCKIHTGREPVRDQEFEWIWVLTLAVRTIHQLNHRQTHLEDMICGLVVPVICFRFSIFPMTLCFGVLFAKVCFFRTKHSNWYICSIKRLYLQVNVDGSSTRLARLNCHQVVFQLDVHLPTLKLCSLALSCTHAELI